MLGDVLTHAFGDAFRYAIGFPAIVIFTGGNS
jgi:hypothetical protein